MNKMSHPSDLTVTATTWLDAQLIHAYLKSNYKNHENVLVIPTTNPKSFEEFYMGTYSQLTQDERDILTDLIIPFHMEPSKHFTLLHVKFVGNEKRPVIYWLDSMGAAMPVNVKKIVNVVFEQPDKVIHERAITHQQTNGYDCGVYVALNADTLVNNNDAGAIIANDNNFEPMNRTQSIKLRKRIVDVANEDLVHQYAYVDTLATSNNHQDQWDENTFINTISDDLIKFGASIANDEDAYTTFDKVFDKAAAAYQKAAASQTKNRFAFFNEYKNLKAQFGQDHATTAGKSCAAELEPILEEGVGFVRVSH